MTGPEPYPSSVPFPPLPGPVSTPDRRAFLRGAGLAGAALIGAGTAGAGLAITGSLGGSERRPPGAPRADDPRFTVAVIPDTQFLFDGDRGDPAPLVSSLEYLIRRRDEDNIAFVAHLGDIVENAAATELREAGRVLGALDAAGLPYSVLAGNHDIDAGTDDQRGDSPYLEVFGPHRFASGPTFGGATRDGYNTYHAFSAAGRTWLLFALDWRPSAGTLRWVRQVLARHRGSPAIVTTHELAAPQPDRTVLLHAHGQRLWDGLIRDHDQIFLTVNGHFWPAARTVLRNSAGNDVHLHVTNYQNRYYGGSGMIRLYRFDTARDVIDVRTFAPWALEQPPERRHPLVAGETELTDPENTFSLPVAFADRFAGFAPRPAKPPRPARTVLLAGTVAYWRCDPAGRDGTPLPIGGRIGDLSGHGNHLIVTGWGAWTPPPPTGPVAAPAGRGGRAALDSGGGPAAGSGPVWSVDRHRDAPSPGSVRFGPAAPGAAGPSSAPGAVQLGAAAGGRQGGGHQGTAPGVEYLRTVPEAPLNRKTFTGGYTIEVYVKLPAGAMGRWMGVLSRPGAGGEVDGAAATGATGRSTGTPDEPLAALGISAGLAPRWAARPAHRDAISTNWGHELPVNEWFHLALVNDGRVTTMYVDGAPVLRNPRTPAVGLATAGRSWLVGVGYRAGVVEAFTGWLGDIRIVDRALSPSCFMA